ncbi:type IX secretion system membrane protein PorP/SprF [Flagellimonas olearia]|uniref:Type IX secretion system membrane protein PorP/SprF n=1 Tax=Flagellimonas olearia TaxID=552546 RepID=A0A6I1E9D6_9FLAO|nr:PorP/SprF family type IX secretion system membrane protein [Allomuricauda olearia]KAB7530334.1 type IX secretion system membrane protein PorP/SprF [Allomuricauda olearia]
MESKGIYGAAIIMVMTIHFGWGQQTVLFPEYNNNPFLVNSAYAGMGFGAEVSLSNYGYVNPIDGSPKTLALSFHTPLAKGKMGIGGVLLRDQIGVANSTQAFFAYSYKVFFDHKSDRPYWQLYDANVLSFGITAGVQQFNEALVELGIPTDPEFSSNVNATVPTVGAGFLYNRANFYVGASAPNLVGDKLSNRDDLDLSSPFYGYLGYRFYNNRFEEFMISPSALFKYEKGAPMQLDLNVMVNFKHRFELGTGYRSSSSINLMGGIYLLKHLKVIYYHNIGIQNTSMGNAHGIIFSYLFNGYE